MKLELSPQAIDTMNLALQAMLVTANATSAELRAAISAAQLAEAAATRAEAEAAQARAKLEAATPRKPRKRLNGGVPAPGNGSLTAEVPPKAT